MQTQKHKPIEPPVPEQQTPSSSNMFMQEDDITYWLHYPIDDTSLQTYLYNNNNNNINDLLYPSPPFSAPVTVPTTYLPPPPPPPSVMLPSCSSNDKPAAVVGGGAGKEVERCEMSVSVTSSPGTSCTGESGGVETAAEKPPSPIGDRKLKYGDKDGDEAEIYSEDAEFGYQDTNKQSHDGSTSNKRSRSAKVHNLSERRRRDRINEKMKALQKLIPRCNKSDKASMLDEAIEYLKSLQTQVHMMSMGCSMFPAMFLGAQQYIPPNPPMGMGMGMGMGMNRAMFPYPVIPPGPSVPNPAVAAATSAAILGQCFPAPGIPVAGPTTPMMSALTLNSQNQPQLLGFADPFQQYHSLQQTKLPIPQKQGGMPQITTKLSSSKPVE